MNRDDYDGWDDGPAETWPANPETDDDAMIKKLLWMAIAAIGILCLITLAYMYVTPDPYR